VNGEIRPDLVQDLSCRLSQGPPPAETEWTGEFAQSIDEDVFSNTDGRVDRNFLKDQGHSQLLRLGQGARTIGLAVQPHLPTVSLDDTGANFKEGGFPGAVFSDQSVHLAWIKAKMHVAQRYGRAKAFANII
jgi:hypothetical protein